MANTFFIATVGLTGTGVDSLDEIAQADIANNDVAITFDSGVVYFHKYNSTATNAESSPDYIRPNDYGSAGVWVLFDVYENNLNHDALTNFLATEHKTSATIRGESGTAIVLETRTSDPGSPVAGQIWLRTDL